MKRFLTSKIVLSLATFLMVSAIFGISLSSIRSALAAFSLDPSFGNGGKVITSFGQDAFYGGSISLQTDNEAVVGGSVYNGNYYDCKLVRYNTDGSIDTSFGTNGIVTQDFGMNCAMYTHSIAIQYDGKIVAAQEPYASGTGFFWKVLRYNSDGSTDLNFGNNGIVSTPMMTGDHDIPYAILVQPNDQKIVVVGWTATTNDSNESLAVVRYNTDGSLDQSFGSGGEVITKIAGSAYIRGKAVEVQQDGKIVVYGDLTYGGDNTLYVARFNSNGSFDTSFGNNGYVTENIGNNPGAQGVIIQSDGKIVIDGVYTPSGQLRSFIIRYNPDGTHDTSFGVQGYVLNPYASYDVGDSTGDILMDDGTIIMGGSSSDGSRQYFALRRLNSDGSIDTSFGSKVPDPI